MVAKFLAAAVLLVAAGVLCAPQYPGFPSNFPQDPRYSWNGYDEEIPVERNNFTEGDCSPYTQELFREYVFRFPIFGCYVSSVVDFIGAGRSDNCNITCIRAENLMPRTTGGNLSVTAGGLGQPTIQLTFMSEYEKGYVYLVELRGVC